MARVSSGVPGLDEVLRGGFIDGLSYLVRGGPGTGKTQLGLHFLSEGARRGEPVLFLSLEHTSELFHTAFASLPFDLDAIPFHSLIEKVEGSGEVYSLFSPADVEQGSQMTKLLSAIDRHKPQRLFVDGFSQTRLLSPNEYQFRRQVLSFLGHCHDSGITTLYSSEAPEDLGDVDLQFMSHGIITLRLSPEMGRSLEVSKSLASGYSEGRHGMTLGEEGVRVFPRLVPGEHVRGFTHETISSGIPELDSMLHGGISRGTVTLVSGPNGVGKTTTGLQFMVDAARRGEKSVLFSFEEEREMLLSRAEAIGQPVREMIEANTLEVVDVEPLLMSADEFAWMVRRYVDEGVSVMMLDSLAGYRMALRGEGLAARMHALTKYLQRMGVTLLIVNEMEKIISTDLSVTDYGVSYLADNVLLLRYVEMGSELRRTMGVLKKRMSDFEKTLREFSITPQGLRLGEPLVAMQGILTGLPHKGD